MLSLTMPSYSVLDWALIAFAALYITHVLTATEGPFHSFQWLRENSRRALGGVLDCAWCTVFWVALGLFIGHQIAPGVTWVFAVAGAAMVIRSYSGVHHG